MAILQMPDDHHTRIASGAIICVTKTPGLPMRGGVGPIPPRIVISLIGPHSHEIDCKDEDDQFERFRMVVEAWAGASH